MTPKTVAVDLDGVLASYDGWRGPEIIGGPLPGAREFVEELQTRGYEPVVHTTRETGVVVAWLALYDFPSIRVEREKPPAVAYVDDRAVRFTGDFGTVLVMIEARAWWEKV